MKRKLIALVVLAVLVSGCAAGRAFRKGREAATNGDWDAAVAHYRTAVQQDPDHPEYRIQLERAMQMAAREHISRAREFETKDQLDAALIEYRKALDMDATNRLAAARAQELEKTIRERIEASRPKPAIDKLREQARQQQAPLLDPTSRAPIKLTFTNASLKDVLNFIATNTGINITFDQTFADKPVSVTMEDVTLEQALQQIMTANQLFYKVLNPRTIIVVPNTAAKHAEYDDLVIRVFFLSHADATEVSQTLNTIMRIPTMPVQPTFLPNKTANTLTVRATAQVMDVIERVIRANDKPRAEVVLDVQILEVNRARAKQYGINLNAYALGFLFSPEVAPPNTSTAPTGPPPSPPPFNVNTISQGVSTADFYMTVPTALIRFLESDDHTRTIAKPQLRGAEGTKLTLNLGDDIPVLSTVFGAPVQGGIASVPQSSFNYRSVGVNLEVTPRVSYEGEIILELTVENSTLGGSIEVAGQLVPTFGTRKVTTKLRLREGESNLLAGLLRERDRKALRGFPGLLRLPVFKQFLSDNDQQIEQTDIVMLLTPHIVRTHELTAEDLAGIFIGTQQNVGLGGPPPLIAPPPEPVAGTAPGAPGTVAGTPPPGTSRPGAQPTNPPVPPGLSPVPGVIPPAGTGTGTAPTGGVPPATGTGAVAPLPPGTTTPPAGTTPPGTTPPGTTPPGTTPPATATTPPGTTPPATATPPPTGTVPPRDPNAPATAPPGAPASPTTPAQVIITAGTEYRIAGGPHTVPISINNVSRLSVMTLTVTFNPAVLRVRSVQEGLFVRQGGVAVTFTPRIDVSAGRVDIAIARTGDQTGASGGGVLAALLFDGVGVGSSTIQVSGVASTPEGTPIALQFSPVTVTVR